MNFCPEITEDLFKESFKKLILDLTQTFNQLLNSMDYKDFWSLTLRDYTWNGSLKACQIAVKILMVENPSNVMAESLGRISNMIRDPKLSSRMGNATLDSRLIVYKNTPCAEFWELHLANLCKLQIDFLGMTFSMPTSGLPTAPKSRKSKKSHKDVYNYDPTKYKPRKTKSQGDTKSQLRRQREERRKAAFNMLCL